MAGVFSGLGLFAVGRILDVPGVEVLAFLLMGAGMSCGMVEAYREGVIRTNWGTVRRDECPIRFQIEGAFWWAVVMSMTVGGILIATGVLGHREP